MSALSHQSFANEDTPFWLSNPVEFLKFSGTPDVEVSNVGGELFGNGVSLSPSTWFQYPANGVIQLDPAGDVLQIISNDLYFNSSLIALAGSISNVADWYLYPALSNVELNTGVGIDFDGRLLSRDGLILRFGGVSLDDSEWALYPAIATLDMNGNAITGVNGLDMNNTGISNVASLSRTGTLTTTADIAQMNVRRLQVAASTLNPLSSTAITLNAGGGTGGQVDIEANSSSGGLVGGRVGIRAVGGAAAGVAYGGEVDITATTGGIGTLGFTSAIKLSAASVLSYAGAVSPFGSLAGYNFVYGTAGVNIVAGTPPVLPNVVGSVYLSGSIGALGSAGGVRISQGAAIDFITPLPLSGNLKIRGNPAGDKVELSNVSQLGMEGSITGLANITMTGNIGNVQTLTMGGVGAISNLVSVNGVAYVSTQNWSTLPAVGNVDMAGFDLNATGQIRFTNSFPTNQSGFQGARGFLGVDGDLVGTIEAGPSNGNFRCREMVLTVPGSYPLDLSNDIKITNAWNYPGTQRVGVITQNFGKVLAYLDDVPTSRGSMSSSVSQSVLNTATPRVFTYTDFGTLVGITESAGQIFSTNGGSYLLTFSIQFSRSGGGGGSVAEAWIRINGSDVPNTNSRVLLAGGASSEIIMTVPVNVDLLAGDYVEVVFGTDNTLVIAEAIPARASPFVAPAIPSIIVNIDQVA